MKLSTAAALVAVATATGLTAMTTADPGAAAPAVSSHPHARPTVTLLVQYARLDVQATPPELTAAPFPH